MEGACGACGTSAARVVRAACGSTLDCLMMEHQQQEENPLSPPKDKPDGQDLVLVAQRPRLKQREHEAREGQGAEGEEDGARRSVESDCLRQDNSQTRVDSTMPLSTSTPVPRMEMPLKKNRSPGCLRTQYLSNLGIWADNQAKQLTSSPRTEARYRRNVGYALLFLSSGCVVFWCFLGLGVFTLLYQSERNRKDRYIFILI